jgi:hypothetical protein
MEAIRRERDKALQRVARSELWFGPVNGLFHGFSAREVLPFEDARGLIPEPDVLLEITQR